MEIQTENGLKEVFSYLETGNPDKARRIVAHLLEIDSTRNEFVFTSTCCNLWSNTTFRILQIESPFERGENLLSEWKSFKSYVNRQKYVYEPTVYAIQKGVFTSALQNFMQVMDEKDTTHKSEIYRKIGLCYKKLGSFENARQCLAEANKLLPNQAPVLADLADCYALCGEDKGAKVLFREAFFVDPQKIDLDFLDSELIRCLINKVQEKNFVGSALQMWIPVYGVLWGIFNIKRELRSQEVGKLRQDIYALENEQKDPSCDLQTLTPRLINMYFWLIDHYVQNNDNQRLINEILLKIKILDTNIYNSYIK